MSDYDPTLYEKLARLEAKSFWFRSRNRLILWALERWFPHAAAFLEIGCGTGYVLAGLREAHPDMRLVGAEFFEEGLEFARRRVPNAELTQLDARELPYREEFDVVGAFDVLEHIDEDERALASIFEATKPGGGVLITVPQHAWLWSAADDVAHHHRRYTRDELVSKLRAAGFEVARATSFVSLLVPLMLLVRLRPSARDPERYDISGELAPGPMNRVFEWLLSVERALIRRGVDLPVGGSLLAVGVRPRMDTV